MFSVSRGFLSIETKKEKRKE